MYTRKTINAGLNEIWMPLVTPFADGQLDEASVTRMIEHYSKTGIAGYVLVGTTGEAMTLSEAEKERLVHVAQAANHQGLPILLGHCGVDTRALADRIERTNSWPIDGYLITAPYYVRPPQDGLYRHYEALAQAAGDLPVILYNIPSRTGCNILNDTVMKLAAIPNIVGIKDCCGNQEQSYDLLARCKALRETTGTVFAVLIGNDDVFFDLVKNGANGGILASAHIDTETYVRIHKLLAAGDIAGAEKHWPQLSQNIALLFKESNPGPVKYWLSVLGLIRTPDMRLPMTGISDDLQQKIRARIPAERAVA